MDERVEGRTNGLADVLRFMHVIEFLVISAEHVDVRVRAGIKAMAGISSSMTIDRGRACESLRQF